MRMVEADKCGKQQRILEGRHVWLTNAVCDRCMGSIHDRVYYHCARECDVDFCAQCQEELMGVMQGFLSAGDRGESAEFVIERMHWVVHVIDEAALHILHRNEEDRMALAKVLAQEWPAELFKRLVGVVVDVCNAKLLFNCSSGALASCVTREGCSTYTVQTHPLYQDSSYAFWYTIGLLQFLYECSGLLQAERVLDGQEARGHKIPVECFILEGINKCNPATEWDQWESLGGVALTSDVLRAPAFQCSRSFRSLAAHNNLLPISFRRQCLVIDIRHQTSKAMSGNSMEPLVLEVEREEEVLIENVCNAFAQLGEVDGSERGGETRKHLIPRPLYVGFKGESYRRGVAARGPGVTREFFQVALRAFLAALFVPAGLRTYWFGHVPKRPEAHFACGALLGQVLWHAEFLPNVFPWPLYDLLLRDLASPRASTLLTLQHLAAVSQDEAQSLSKVKEYEGDDIGELFGDLGWERVAELEGKTLTQATKNFFVDAYVRWSFGPKIKDCYRPFSDGFCAILGMSVMIREMVDAKQLERIMCGGGVPVDVAAIRRRALLLNWDKADEAYTEAFWSVLAGLPDAARQQFAVFVTGSDRMPLNGWEDLRIKIQKNGTGDERWPTAYTCFSLVLLPVYSSTDILRQRLLSAITDSQGFGLH
mmetsp:Transcript_30890/g.71755  ORF Transcript_30890/g.71755 Transcript_30890/m.71755 type:complete len:652 (+) Transcript_30890:397-2352(+)